MTDVSVVVAIFGPERTARTALRRAHGLAGRNGRVLAVAANRVSGPIVAAMPRGRVEVVDTVGSRGLAEALSALGDEPVLFLHDDVYVDAASVDAMVAAWDTPHRLVVPWTNELGIDNYAGKLPPVARGRDRLRRHAAELELPDAHATTTRTSCLLSSSSRLLEVASGTLQVATTALELHLDPARVAGGAVAAHDASCVRELHDPTGPDGRPLLVAALIVRDEEEMLADCLASLDGLVDRIEVCDTGSTDRTVEIAESFGARVIHREWRDDFSAARNEVLENARDAWFVLQVDADERVECGNVEDVRRSLATSAGEHIAYSIDIYNLRTHEEVPTPRSRSSALRVFPSQATAYEGALHEHPMSTDAGRALSVIHSSGFHLRHLGYDSRVFTERGKEQRNVAIAEASYRRAPTSEHALNLARSLMVEKQDPMRRAALLQQALSAGIVDIAYRAHALTMYADVLLELGEADRSLALAGEALDLVPADEAAKLAYVNAARRLGRADLAVQQGLHDSGHSPRALNDSVDRRLARRAAVVSARLEAGDVETAIAELEELLREDAEAFSDWPQLVRVLVQRDAVDAYERLVALARLDATGAVFDAVGAALPPQALSRFCVAYVASGGAHPAGIQTGLVAALVARDVDDLQRLAPHAGVLQRADVLRLADHAARKGLDGAADLLRGTRAGERRRAAAAVTVLGMHRSATSALSAVLSELGVHFGDPGQFIAPAPDNPRGFYENRDIVALNDRLLDHLGGSWDAPPPLPPGWWDSPSLGGLREEARSLWTALDGGQQRLAVGWKDPRASLLFPFWEGVIGDLAGAHRAVHLVREPDQVAMSLQRRNDIDPEHAARLWLAYVGASLRNRSDALVLFQRELFTDLDGVIDCLARWLDLDVDEATRERASAAIDPCLWRQRDVHAGEGPWMGLAREVYERLRRGGEPDVVGHLAARGSDRLLDGLDGSRRASVLVASASLGDEACGALESLGRELWHDEARPTLVAGDIGHLDHYRLQTSGWWTETLDPAAAIRRFSPDVALATTDDVDSSLLQGILEHDPTTRWLARAGGASSDLADGVLDPSDADVGRELVRAIHDGRHGVPSLSPPPAIPKRPSLPGVVSVVIPVLNNWHLTQACLDHVARTTAHVPTEIVVVDNGSDDGTPAGLSARSDVDVVVRNDHNLGFAAASNQGIAASKGQYVCVLNNDTEPVDAWLDELLIALHTPGTGLAGPRTNDIHGSQRIPGAPTFDVADSREAHDWAERWMVGRPRVSWLTSRLVGFCLLGRRKLFEAVGGFDAGVGLGNFEDDELCHRVRAQGSTLRVAERAVVLHHGGATFRSEGIDHATAMLAGARHTAGRLQPSTDLAVGVVLSNGQGSEAAATAADLLRVLEHVEIWERQESADTHRPAASLPRRCVVRSVEWQDDDAAAAAASRVAGPRLVIMGAGERLSVSDRVGAAVELERVGRGVGLAHVHGGAEIRVVSREHTRLVGNAAAEALEHLRVA